MPRARTRSAGRGEADARVCGDRELPGRTAARWGGLTPAVKLRRARLRSREGERGRERHGSDPHLAAKLGQVFSLSRTRRPVRSMVVRSSTRRQRQRRCAARAPEAAAAALGFNEGCGALGEGPL